MRPVAALVVFAFLWAVAPLPAAADEGVQLLAQVPAGLTIDRGELNCTSAVGDRCTSPTAVLTLVMDQDWVDAGRPVLAPASGTVVDFNDLYGHLLLQLDDGTRIDIGELASGPLTRSLVGQSVATGTFLGNGAEFAAGPGTPNFAISLSPSVPPPYILEGAQLPWQKNGSATQIISTGEFPMQSSNEPLDSSRTRQL